MTKVFLLLGGNLGDRNENLRQARNQIATKIGVINNQSSIYETEPWGFSDEIWFLNQVISVSTDFQPFPLLHEIHKIENLLGRTREVPGYTGRTMDIDILFYGDKIISTPTLTIPHPRLHQRLFTLLPIKEIADNFVHPVLHKTIEEILSLCDDKTHVNYFNKF